MPDVGIVMPVYRQNLEHLRIALRSVLNQTYGNYRFVIVGDGAPDDVARTIREETAGDYRVQVILKPNNEGCAAALNLGFDILMADPEIEYLTWVSSDNDYYPFFLETLVREMRAAPPEVGIVYSSFRQILEDGSPAHAESFLQSLRAWQNAPKEALLDNCIIGPSFLHRTSVCRIVGYYRLDPIQDYDYWIRMSEYCELMYIPIELMAYRVNSPYAETTKIKSSREAHRRCWDSVHIAQFEARQRRGIAPEVTIVFPVRDLSPQTIAKLDSIVDQSFTNFDLSIIDLTPSGSAGYLLSIVRDPRIRLIRPAARSLRWALQSEIQQAVAPYMFLVNPNRAVVPRDSLKQMAFRLAVNPGLLSARSRGASVRIRTRFAGTVALGELYRTVRLRAFVTRYPAFRITGANRTSAIRRIKRTRRMKSRLSKTPGRIKPRISPIKTRPASAAGKARLRKVR